MFPRGQETVYYAGTGVWKEHVSFPTLDIIIMTKWQDFLLEHAKFLFPDTVDSGSANSADVSSLEIGDITKPWKAKYAIRDETLVANLCLTLEKILGDTPIEVPEDTLRSLFGRHLGFLPSRSGAGEHRVLTWTRNRNEIEVQNLDSHSRIGSPC